MTTLLARNLWILLLVALLCGGCDGCREAPRAGHKIGETPPPGSTAPPKKEPERKRPNRGPDPAPLNYPVSVKIRGKVLTYNPNDTNDDMAQQFGNRHEDKAQVVGLLPIKAGMTVADVGCGAGYFTPDLARLVGAPGKVFALDIKRELIQDLKRRLRKKPALDPHNVIQARVSPMDDVGLPAASVDVVFLAHLDFYLHSPLPKPLARFIKSCQRALTKDGKLVILQWMQVPSQYMDDKGATAAYSKRNLLDNMAAVGLVMEAEHNIRSPKKRSDRTKLFVFKRAR